jgi:hypothetical protein
MTAAELTEGCYRARTRFNTYASILRRSFGRGPDGRPANLPGFSLLVNVISRRQIHRKQGAPLGDGGLPPPVYEEGRA